MTHPIISSPDSGAPVPIFTRGKSCVPKCAIMLLIPLCPPADPFGRTRSFPTGNEMSSKMISVLDGGILTLYGPDDTTLGRLDNDRVRGVLTELSGAVRIAFREGEPPKASPEENLRQLLAFSRQYDNIVVKGGQE